MTEPTNTPKGGASEPPQPSNAERDEAKRDGDGIREVLRAALHESADKVADEIGDFAVELLKLRERSAEPSQPSAPNELKPGPLPLSEPSPDEGKDGQSDAAFAQWMAERDAYWRKHDPGYYISDSERSLAWDAWDAAVRWRASNGAAGR